MCYTNTISQHWHFTYGSIARAVHHKRQTLLLSRGRYDGRELTAQVEDASTCPEAVVDRFWSEFIPLVLSSFSTHACDTTVSAHHQQQQQQQDVAEERDASGTSGVDRTLLRVATAVRAHFSAEKSGEKLLAAFEMVAARLALRLCSRLQPSAFCNPSPQLGTRSVSRYWRERGLL